MNVNNSSHSTAPQRIPGPALHTEITLYSLLLVWSLLGNVFVIAVVYYNQNVRSNTNYLIVNMAVSDLLVPLVAMPYGISLHMTNGQWLVDGPLGEVLCKMVSFLSDLSPSVSSISLTVIAVQRLIAVVYPTGRQILTAKTRWLSISLPWIISAALFSPYFYIYRLFKGEYAKCDYSWSPAFDHITADRIFTVIILAISFIIPLFTIIIIYAIVLHQLRQNLKNVMEMIDREAIRSRHRRNRRIFGMLITIIVNFTICWSPLYVLNMLHVFERHLPLSMDEETSNNILFALYIMWNLLPAINPCIYFLFLKDFRQGLKRLCCRENECVCCLRRVAPGGQSNRHQPKVYTLPHINTTPV